MSLLASVDCNDTTISRPSGDVDDGAVLARAIEIDPSSARRTSNVLVSPTVNLTAVCVPLLSSKTSMVTSE